jgi:hypothetical protein
MIFLLFTVGWGFFVGCATKGFEGECRECDVGKMTDIFKPRRRIDAEKATSYLFKKLIG